MKRIYLLVFLLAAFVLYAAWTFADTVTPYVGIAEAKSSAQNVQVKGLLAKDAPAPHSEGNDFLFSLADEETGETMRVRYAGPKPDQFDSAYHIVAIGKYGDGEFHANKLLIKCPSKYEAERQ